MQQAVRRAGIRARRALPRPPRRAVRRPGASGHQPTDALRRRTFSPCTRRPGSSASRCSSSATSRTGATAPISPRPTARSRPAEVLSAFLAQFYDDKPTPRLVLLSQEIEERELLAEALCARAGLTRRSRRAPARREARSRGARLHQCARGAGPAAGRHLVAAQAAGRAWRQAFGLRGPSRRVEVYDNSHIMGTNAVGAMVVAGPQGFSKTHYRTFNIRSEDLTPGDDFGMMREVLMRRFARLMKEAPRAGGPRQRREPARAAGRDRRNAGLARSRPHRRRTRQLDAARAALAELGVDGRAARRRRQRAGPRRRARNASSCRAASRSSSPPRDPALYFIQRLRDEAHRFAIGTHRAKRKREFTKSPLDEISGIGPARKRALLLHFGTAKAIAARLARRSRQRAGRESRDGEGRSTISFTRGEP